MALEIERKFLLRPGMTLPSSDHVENIRQCYLVSDDALVVRVRIIDEERAILGIKIAHEETLSVRTEYEYEIPIEEALEMMSVASTTPIVKQRHVIEMGERKWEVDFFEEENEGLIVAEVELPSLETSLPLPEWIGREVTDDKRYTNGSLARHPYVEGQDEVAEA